VTVRVKICGITRLEDALEAVRFGADALGFNFWPRSKRHCATEVAAEIISRLPPFVATVGVFVNQSRAEINRVVARTGIGAVQLHGDETPELARALKRPVIRAVRIEGPASLSELERWSASAFLLDTASAGYGGSGTTFDWRLAKGAGKRFPILLAGGLTPANVADAVKQVRPYGVDVASGVESAPGLKDSRKMRRFITAAKEAL
jgi:phosphoribosylanthranilate isomerase